LFIKTICDPKGIIAMAELKTKKSNDLDFLVKSLGKNFTN
jgi:hypothetical protein